jgi:hypothetical protein
MEDRSRCGTPAGFRRHERAGETPVGQYCQECREAENERHRAMHRRRRERELARQENSV